VDETVQRAGADRSADEQRWAELADRVLIIAREITFRGYTDERAVPLSQSEGMVMRYLQHEPEAAPSRIAHATGLKRTNLSTVLGGLERKGLIERRASPGDGRGVTVRLTDRGRTNYHLVRQDWAATVSAAAGGDTTNLEAVLAVLAAVEEGLVRSRSTADPRGTGAPRLTEVRDADFRRDARS
jgi:DNA-binding MarR family transcriptional regulator